MVALNRANIPPAINTVERLMTWCALVLQDATHPETLKVEVNQPSQPRCSVVMAPLANNETTFCISAYIPYDTADLASPTMQPWMAAQDVSTAGQNTNFSSN
jgi:hypothetical protein